MEEKNKKVKVGKKVSRRKVAKKLEKKSKKINPILFIFIVIIVIVAVFGIIFAAKRCSREKTTEEIVNTILTKNMSTDYAYICNGLAFYKQDKFWYTRMAINDIPFDLELYYGPKELGNIKINYNENNFSTLLYKYRKVYITFDPDSENKSYIAVAGASLAESLLKVYSIQAVSACSKNVTDCSAKPIITCDNTNRPVIYIKESPALNITYDKNCLIIEGRNVDLIKAANKVLYGWYNIVNCTS